MGTNDRADKSKRGTIVVSVTDDGAPVTGASVSLFQAPEALKYCADFLPAKWKPADGEYRGTVATRPEPDSEDEEPREGVAAFENLEPGLYILRYEHRPEQKAQCVEVKPRCVSHACFDLDLGVSIAVKDLTDDCREIPCATPRLGDSEQVTLTWKDAGVDRSPFALIGPDDAIETADGTFVRPLASAGENQSVYLLALPSRGPLPGGLPAPPPANRPLTNRVIAAPRAAQNVAGSLGVSLQRTATALTADVSHWGAILNITDAMSFNNYDRFMKMVFCGERDLSELPPFERERFLTKENVGRNLLTRRSLPFIDTDAYRFVKVATEAFVMVNCGIISEQRRPFFARRDSGYFDRRDVPFPSNGLDALFTNDYLTRVSGGSLGALTLPYLAVIRRKLGDIDINIRGFEFSAQQASECYGILQEKLTNPCLLELIWSYWHEEGMLVQTTNAITRRFQNVRGSASQDPLANLEVDPLRPLNNLLWGYVQDEQHRLSVVRRNYEYDHHYGLRLDGRAVQGMKPADTPLEVPRGVPQPAAPVHDVLQAGRRHDDQGRRLPGAERAEGGAPHSHGGPAQPVRRSRFDRARRDADAGVAAGPAGVPRVPADAHQVAYPEPWMDRVDAMKKLQGWSDTSVLHFRNLGLFGEQVLLGIRWGFWSDVQEPEQAFNWARLFRPQIQGYIHAYRAVAGVDLSAETTVDTQVDATMPSTLLKRRLTAQQQRGA